MQIDKKAILNQIDVVLEMVGNINSKYQLKPGGLIYKISDDEVIEKSKAITLCATTLDRLAPPESPYIKNAGDVLKMYGTDSRYSLRVLMGILKALRNDYEAGYLETIHELIHADIFEDFLEMADYLLKGGYKDPAAVIAGGVLEEHLRKLCVKSAISIMQEDKYKLANNLNQELTAKKIYTSLDHKSVLTWQDLRNKAAHAQYDEYDKEQVELMIQGIRNFISKYPA